MIGDEARPRLVLIRTGRGARYLLGTLVTAIVTLVAAPLLCVPSLATAWAERHRRHAGALLERPVRLRPPALVRELAWFVIQVVGGLPVGAFALLCLGNLLLTLAAAVGWWAFPTSDPPRLLLLDVPVDSWASALTVNLAQLLLLTALTVTALPLLARAHARCCLAVLAPSPVQRMAARVTELTRTRTDVLQAHGAELRRIERDLHDGTQARLVAIAIRLAVAGQSLPQDPQTAAALVGQARAETEEAMTELRSVIRTIYPPVLADQGLAGALRTLTTRAGVPTRIDVGDLGEVPAAVEAVAYFAVTETLANIARHSRATRATVRVTRGTHVPHDTHGGAVLAVEVSDDGTGGADASRGSGLDGIGRRAAALDGTMKISSPPGGPTIITVELPCA
ncbi:sensor histidine kinase [Streptomyces sp. NPDC004327]|uniref:sensor histidine kinase n=1 Tax=Streptomyces sp. NPDC004327 TaxID=3364699 RepID=UPI0036B4C4BC